MKFKKTPENLARLLFWSALGLSAAAMLAFGITAYFPLDMDTYLIMMTLWFMFAFDRVQVIAEGG